LLGVLEIISHGTNGTTGLLSQFEIGERSTLSEGVLETLENGGRDGSS
jgi:hypothetical protein